MNTIYEQLVTFILDILFPKDKALLEIERMKFSEISLLMKTGEDLVKNKFTIIALLKYQDKLTRKMIWEVKYRKNLKIINIFAHIIQEALPQRIENEFLYHHFKDFIMVPIPLSKKRFRLRGYNQTSLILKKLCALYDYEYLDALIKTKETQTQTNLRRAERLTNQKNVFTVKDEVVKLIENKNILLFDDVTTTGATLFEARKVLLRAGARRVVGLTLAH